VERAGAAFRRSRRLARDCGLAPGKHGANRTGRPFTGDHAGVLLYETLLKFGLAEGRYEERPDDSLRLKRRRDRQFGQMPAAAEQADAAGDRHLHANLFQPSLAALPKVRVLVALGQIAHDAAVRAAGGKLSAYKFGHLAEHRLPDGRILIDSYHCSRYNQNTNRLTPRCSSRSSRGRWSSR
jgi:uracil-DNA glycosylase